MTKIVSQITITMESVPGEERNSMYSYVMSGTIFGIQGMMIQVEADVSDGLPGFHLVGSLSKEIRESGERIRTALRNIGVCLPPKRVVVNLSPADVHKAGSGFDLPIAIATLISIGIIPRENVDDIVILGELGLDGRILPVNGVLPIADCAAKAGYRYIIVPEENKQEAALVEQIAVIGADHLKGLVEQLHNKENFNGAVYVPEKKEFIEVGHPSFDFRDLKGQPVVRRTMEIAASGMHNLLMTGPPGAGKTLAAKCITGILPDLTFEEQMELTKIYSVKGLLSKQNQMLTKPPFRAPHHTITASALIGGGCIPKPGEISLAHNGVLFLDELPEFSRNVIEVLRQPLEEEVVRISRLNQNFEFPAKIMLVAARNPCPCGCYPDRNRCHCTDSQILSYQGKISRAILDRIDLHVNVQPVSYEEMVGNRKWESSETIRDRIRMVHSIQQKRYKNKKIRFNSQLDVESIQEVCRLSGEEQKFIQTLYENHSLSGRAYHRLLKLARTIADMEGEEDIRLPHLMEAASYRFPDWDSPVRLGGVGDGK